MTKQTPWAVQPDSKDPEMYEVAGIYLVARNLPIEDANLIAAAPDLLEALQTAMQWIKAWDVGFLFDDEWAADEAKIKAALAKAGAA